MAVYSANRVGSIKESNDMREIMESIEAGVPEVGSMFEDNILESVIFMHENDMKMFDAMIECDFISVTNEQVMLEADAEAANKEGNKKKKSGILKKIKEFFAKVIEAIKKAAQTAMAKFISLVKNDKKLVEKYQKTLTMENMKGFKGIVNFALPYTTNLLSSMGEIKEGEGAFLYNKFAQKVKAATDKEALNAAIDEFGKTTDSKTWKENYEKSIKKLMGKPQEAWIPSSQGILDRIKKDVVDAKATTELVKSIAAKSIANLKATEASVKADIEKAGEDELEIAKANALYNGASKTTQVFTKKFSAYVNATSRIFAQSRKAFIICGRYALKTANGEAVDEAVDMEIVNMLAEASDIYVAECLA